ncbi:MC/SLC25 family protein [Chlamydiota bacterium]
MSNPVNSSRGAVTEYPPPEAHKNRPAHFWQNVCVAVVSIAQPMIYFKNVSQAKARQEGKSAPPVKGIAKDIRVWYRGVYGFAASFAPTAAIQIAANGIFSSVMDPSLAAPAAGMVSAIAVCPAEGIMIQQQKGKTFWGTAQQIYSNHGVQGFYRAFVPTAIREGAFTAAYLGAAPWMKEKMQSFGVNEWIAQVIAGVVAGTVATIPTHPFDTYKTQKQGDFSMKMPMIKAIFQKTAFAGLKWRVAIIATATTVMPIVQEKLNAKIAQARH